MATSLAFIGFLLVYSFKDSGSSSNSSDQRVDHDTGTIESSLQLTLDGGSSVDTIDLIRGEFNERPDGFEFVHDAHQGE